MSDGDCAGAPAARGFGMTDTDAPVLVAVDTSESSDEAIWQADAHARSAGCPLVVCTMLPDLLQLNALLPKLGVPLDLGAIKSAIEARILDRVTALTRRPRADTVVRILVHAPHSALIEEARTLGARLVVVAAPDAPGVVATLLGTVAERVVRFATCPVLVARPRTLSGRVLVATDFSDPALPAVHAAAAEVARIGGKLTAAHVVDLSALDWLNSSFTPSANWMQLSSGTFESLRAAAEKRLEEALAASSASGDVLALAGEPVRSIVAAAEDLRAELVVVGTLGRTGLRRVLLGSVAEGVVRHARTSVLVVRLAESAHEGSSA